MRSAARTVRRLTRPRPPQTCTAGKAESGPLKGKTCSCPDDPLCTRCERARHQRLPGLSPPRRATLSHRATTQLHVDGGGRPLQALREEIVPPPGTVHRKLSRRPCPRAQWIVSPRAECIRRVELPRRGAFAWTRLLTSSRLPRACAQCWEVLFGHRGDMFGRKSRRRGWRLSMWGQGLVQDLRV